MIERFQLLRNVGQFDSVAAGAQLPLTKLTAIFAENGRGKTTLAAILRSLSSGDPALITDRQRLGAAQPPHIVLRIAGRPQPTVFQDGAWSTINRDIVVFDDLFVAQNVCSGIEIETEHRQNLHEFILGAQGVALNTELQAHIAAIEQHNRTLRARAQAIPLSVRGPMSVETFCALEVDQHIAEKISAAERDLAAARSAQDIQRAEKFRVLTLPAFDVAAIDALLRRDLQAMDAETLAEVQRHFGTLGAGGENWIEDGVGRIAAASAGREHEICPFCAQDLRGSHIVQHFRAYFSDAYADLKAAIDRQIALITTNHSGDIAAAFERDVRVAIQCREFWKNFIDVPDVAIDTAAIARAWIAGRDGILAALRRKQLAPLDRIELSHETRVAIATFADFCTEVSRISNALLAANQSIAMAKERAATANVSALTSDLAKLKTIAARHSREIAPLCQAYLEEAAAKAAREARRDDARRALDQYRQQVFPAYESAINQYLHQFNAGFRVAQVEGVNMRGGSAASYSVLINNVPVSLNGAAGPSFRNTLSAGDRNTLALAFFFASLDRDPQLAQKIVVIDDPMTSLDEHRSLATIQEIRRLVTRVKQVIVLSHSKPFLCALWEGADVTTRSAMKIIRDGNGSTLSAWDVRQDCISEHDKRHALVADYLRNGDAASERAVASALRPILECFMRVAYPEAFPPGSLLGPFIGTCEQRVGTPNQLLSSNDIVELRDILDYANKFHHDTNPAWETEVINDQQLVHFARRTLAFTRRA